MCRVKDKLPHVSSKFKANLFWMGKQPFIKGKTYKLKVATQQVPVMLADIVSVMNASELSAAKKPHVDRHEVAECVFETMKPVAFDAVGDIAETGRFVIVDNYEISGGGIILAPVFDKESSLKQHIKQRDYEWERSHITPEKRSDEYELDMLKSLTQPNKTLVIRVGEGSFSDAQADLTLVENEDPQAAVKKIVDLLVRSVVLDPEYFI